MTRNEQFIKKWLGNPELEQQPWWRRYKSLEYNQAMPSLILARQRLCRTAYEISRTGQEVLAAALYEKQRRQSEQSGGETLEAWAKRARARVNNRLSGKIRDMPLSKTDAETYYRIIDRRVARLSN